MAASLHARCLVVEEGRAVFAAGSPTAPCPANLDDLDRPSCPSRGCPFKGEPHLARMDEGTHTLGQLFWCTGGRPTNRRALSDGLAQIVATALRDSGQLVVS